MTLEHYEAICKDLEETYLGLLPLCRSYGYKSRGTFYELHDSSEELADRYTRAREKQLDYLEELLREVSFCEKQDKEVIDKVNIGSNAIARDRLKADTIKFILGKLRSHKWGQKVEVTHVGEPRIFNIEY